MSEKQQIVAFLDHAAALVLMDAGKLISGEPSSEKSSSAQTGIQIALHISQCARRVEAGQHLLLTPTSETAS